MDVPTISITNTSVKLSANNLESAATVENIDTVIRQTFPESGLLMPAIRWISPSTHSVIVERPPFIARAAYRPAEAGVLGADEAYTYDLPVPWQVYGITFGPNFDSVAEMRVYVRSTPVNAFTDQLFMFPYPNVFNNAQACLGTQFNTQFSKANVSTLSDAIATTLNMFWMADFNDDIGEPQNTWLAAWRAHRGVLTNDDRYRLDRNRMTPAELLQAYSKVKLDTLLRSTMPLSNGIDGDGDTLQLLKDRLLAQDPFPMNSLADMYSTLRKVYNDAFVLGAKARRK